MVKDYNSVNWVDLLYYDESSPTFLRWKIEHRRGKYKQVLVSKIGDVAGHIAKDGYVKIKYSGVKYFGHRIVFVLFNGEIQNDKVIDHLDGDRSNNRPSNLRLVNNKLNLRNSSLSSRNKSGVSGVFFNEGNNSYYATWYDINGKPRSKSFSASKYENAFALACDYRLKILNELNLLGAGYSERHIENSIMINTGNFK